PARMITFFPYTTLFRSPYKFFLEWKRIEEDEEGVVSLDTMLKGTCAPHRLMDIFENFLLFDESHGDVVKIMAKNHQYIGVNKVLDRKSTRLNSSHVKNS